MEGRPLLPGTDRRTRRDRCLRARLRLLRLTTPGSLAGRYPEGNTGGARVSLHQPMPTAPDLAAPLHPVTTRPGFTLQRYARPVVVRAKCSTETNSHGPDARVFGDMQC
ncbi:DUF3703 domain-containing protein [Nocardia sp. NPDC023852]|uniref:DUF3703 domain-containing protein n=1 Tax=Nocardia sp. NPDC023852 TaxID=3154697 RepID=UPI0033DDC003